MDGVTVEIEVERVINLVRGFGWEKEKEELVDDQIRLEIKKKITPAAVAAGGLEVERVMNLVSGFSWTKVREELSEGVIHLLITKSSGAAAAAGPGPGPS